jgi:hypothetical protein
MPVKVSNATAVYTIMMLVFATGMWAILVFGSTLEARPDLAGEWELLPERDGVEPLRATIEQSGRFVRLRLGEATTRIDLRMSPEVSSTRAAIELRGDEGATARFDRTPAPDVFRLTLDLPGGRRRFTARIVERAYPRPIPTHKQQATHVPADAASHANRAHAP